MGTPGGGVDDHGLHTWPRTADVLRCSFSLTQCAPKAAATVSGSRKRAVVSLGTSLCVGAPPTTLSGDFFVGVASLEARPEAMFELLEVPNPFAKNVGTQAPPLPLLLSMVFAAPSWFRQVRPGFSSPFALFVVDPQPAPTASAPPVPSRAILGNESLRLC